MHSWKLIIYYNNNEMSPLGFLGTCLTKEVFNYLTFGATYHTKPELLIEYSTQQVPYAVHFSQIKTMCQVCEATHN